MLENRKKWEVSFSLIVNFYFNKQRWSVFTTNQSRPARIPSSYEASVISSGLKKREIPQFSSLTLTEYFHSQTVNWRHDSIFDYPLTPCPVSLLKYSDKHNRNYCTEITGLKKTSAVFLSMFLLNKLSEILTKYSKKNKRRMSKCLASSPNNKS